MQILNLNKYIILFLIFCILGCSNILADNLMHEDKAFIDQNTIHGYLINKLLIEDAGDYKIKLTNKENNTKREITINPNSTIEIKGIIPAGKGNGLKSEIILYAKLVDNQKCLLSKTTYGFLKIGCIQSKKNDPAITPKEKIIKLETSGSQLSDVNFAAAGHTINKLINTLDENLILNSQDSSFFISMNDFISKFKVFATLMLFLYTFWYGVDVVSGAINGGSKNDIILFLIKMICVIYFSTGFTINRSSNNKNGMQEFGLPTIKAIVFYISKSVTTVSNIQRIQNQFKTGWQYNNENITYSLTDPIDASLTNILKNNGLFDKISEKTSDQNLGNRTIKIIAAVIIFIIMFIIIFDLITIYAINIIMIYFLTYTSVIFIPCILLNSTRKYYENWLNFLVSCIVHIIVLSAFLGFILFLIDYFWQIQLLNIFATLLMSIAIFLLYKEILSLIIKITDGLTGAIKMFNIGMPQKKEEKKETKTSQDQAGSTIKADKGAATLEGDKGVAALAGGDKGVAALAGGDKGVATLAGGDKGVAALAGGDKGVAALAGGDKGVATSIGNSAAAIK